MLDDYRETLRQGVLNAEKRHTLTSIAEAIGCSRPAISKFKNDGTLGSDFRAALEEWLAANGYLPEEVSVEPVINPSKSRSVSDLIADECDMIAAVMRSDLPQEVKADRFLSFVQGYSEGYLAALKAGSKAPSK